MSHDDCSTYGTYGSRAGWKTDGRVHLQHFVPAVAREADHRVVFLLPLQTHHLVHAHLVQEKLDSEAVHIDTHFDSVARAPISVRLRRTQVPEASARPFLIPRPVIDRVAHHFIAINRSRSEIGGAHSLIADRHALDVASRNDPNLLLLDVALEDLNREFVTSALQTFREQNHFPV